MTNMNLIDMQFTYTVFTRFLDIPEPHYYYQR